MFGPNPTTLKTTLGLGVIAVVGGLSACTGHGPMDRLDMEAQRIVEAQQARSSDPDYLSDQPPIYDETPPTQNRPAELLEVSPAQPRDSNPYPAVLDDGTAPDAVVFDLEKLLAYAIANSPDYKREKEDLFLATLSLIIERHEWGPRFFSAVTGQLAGSPEAGDRETAASIIGSLGVTQRLPYGGTISATALADYVNFLETTATTTDDEADSVGFEFGLDLPLLRGAGKDTQVYGDRLQTERNLIYAVRDFQRFRREFLVDISTQYFDILRRQQQLVNRDRQLVSLDRLTAQFNALAEAGRVPQFQAERAEQRVLFRRNSLLGQQESYVRTLDNLKLQIGMDPRQPLEILAVTVALPEPDIDVEQSILTAFDQRLDLQNEEDFVDDARRDVRIAKNDLLADFDLTADAEVLNASDDAGSSFDLDAGDVDYTVALRYALPLDRKIEQAELRASMVRLEQQVRSYRTERDRVSIQVRRAVRSIEQALFTLDLQIRNVQIAERRAEQVRLNQRALGSKEVIEAQEDLLDARDLRDRARSELQANILQYLLDSGQLRVEADGTWRSPGRLIVDTDVQNTQAGFPALDETAVE